MHACCKLLTTLRYASLKPVYFPINAILMGSVRLSHRSAMFAFHSERSSLSLPLRPSTLQMVWCAPWDSIKPGTRQILLTSCMVSTQCGSTCVNKASLSLTLASSGFAQRQASRLGFKPSERSTWTLCCVGFVFCSPTTPMTGTSDTCTLHKLPGPTLNWNWRRASMKGMDSMSPMVPPSSITHTSGTPALPSTGRCATRWIQSWMASVMCGTTCTVLPR
mmetsp:Transcript_16374/g.44882  ORF Transcript_16374/g.44882 Transcript_16374/m.44882 type:complete len:220 (-) Transcript_16374:337-996(-)